MSGSLLRILGCLQVSNELCFRAVKLNTVKIISARKFSISLGNKSSQLKLTSDNILCSPYPDIGTYEGILLHEQISKNWDKWHDNTALVCSVSGRSYTYDQLRKLSGKLATSLRKLKLEAGDVIALVLPNIPEFAIFILAASKCGLSTTLINPAYTSYEIRKQLINSDAKVVITTPKNHSDIEKSVEGCKDIKLPTIVINDGTGSTPAGSIKFEDLVRDDIEEISDNFRAQSKDTIFLPFSSGTTGLPKGVNLSHRNIVSNLLQLSQKEIYRGVETSATEQDVVPAVLPLFHIYGLTVTLCQYLMHGAKVVCVPQFSMTELLKVLGDFKATLLYVPPPIVHMMANDPNISLDHGKFLRLVMSGAAPLGKESIALFRKRVNPTVDIIQGYGATETSPVISVSKRAPSECSGNVVSNTQIRIVETTEGKNLGPNEIGEVYVRGPQVMEGYYKNPEATAQTMDGDWFKTGDLAMYDDNGLIYIKGRLKELIKVKGFQVAPAELEEVIRGFEKVKDVAVIGTNHEMYGEIPKAFIVAHDGVTISEDEVKNFVAERVAKYKRLGQVQFIDSIPKSAAGKILRRTLQDM